jgi:RimJ/RimL family protein N-acetyltransferase
MPNAEIVHGSFSIMAVQPDHIEPIRQWRNAQMDVLRQSSPITPEAQRSYFDTVIWPDLDSPRPRQLLVSFFRENELVGYGGLVHLSWPDLRGEVSFLLNPVHIEDPATYEALFSGYLDLVKRLAFEELGLKRIFTETYAHRTAHIGILERNGFQLEGRLRGHVRINDRPVDSLLHGLTMYDER